MSENLTDTNVGNIEYIRKADAIDDLHTQLMYRMGSDDMKRRLDDWVKTLPSADVVQVVHAYWIQTSAEDEDGNAYYSCSNCGSGESHNPIVEVPYCWKCGAKMDGGNYDSLHN